MKKKNLFSFNAILAAGIALLVFSCTANPALIGTGNINWIWEKELTSNEISKLGILPADVEKGYLDDIYQFGSGNQCTYDIKYKMNYVSSLDEATKAKYEGDLGYLEMTSKKHMTWSTDGDLVFCNGVFKGTYSGGVLMINGNKYVKSK